MAGGADRRTLVLALAGTSLALLLLRFPLASATQGLWFTLVAILSFALLGLPLMLAEAALGQYRRRNVVDAYGPGPWRLAGFAHALGATAAAALLAILAGWSARFAYGSFEGLWFDDPGRHFRLLAAGPDAVLWTVGVLAVATAIAMRGVGRGLRGTVAAGSILALVLLAGLALWANLQEGASAGRELLYDGGTAGIDAPFVVRAVLAGLLPAMLATGVASTLAAQSPDRRLPRELFVVVELSALGLVAALLFLGPLAASEGHSFGSSQFEAFTLVPTLLGSIGGATGGFLAGMFYAALLFAAFVGLLALLEVPSTWLAESYRSWTESHGVLAAGLAAVLVAVPFCFSTAAVGRLDESLAWIGAPLAGLLVSLHVGWARPEVLDGFRVGDAGHRVDAALRPALRFVLAPLFLLLLVLGILGVVDGGSSGLWRLAP
jgi:neurotransmitter:Na+ symporter, NSS family